MVWRVLVKRLRERLDLSQDELAKVLKRSANTVSRWERGVLVPNARAREQMRDMMQNEPLLATLRVIEQSPTCTRYSLYYTPWQTVSCSPSYARLYGKTPAQLHDKSIWCLLPKAGRDIAMAVSIHPRVLDNTAVNVDATMPFQDGSLRIWGEAFLMDFWRWDLIYSSDRQPPVLRISTLSDLPLSPDA